MYLVMWDALSDEKSDLAGRRQLQDFSVMSVTELVSIFNNFWDSPNLGGHVPVFISLRNRVANLYPRALGSTHNPPPYADIYCHNGKHIPHVEAKFVADTYVYS
jgi:hypothetical protein